MENRNVRAFRFSSRLLSGIRSLQVKEACFVEEQAANWPCVRKPVFEHVRFFVTPWTVAHKAPLSSIISWGLLKFMSIESVTLSNHLILCHSLLFFLSVFPSIRVFSNESALHIRLPKYWSFSFSISPSSEY